MPIALELNEQSAQNKKHDIKHEQTFNQIVIDPVAYEHLLFCMMPFGNIYKSVLIGGLWSKGNLMCGVI